jgi:translation initiation factor IF-2
MTEDIKVTRLSKAAREFNVGISTIVDFLHKKGFDLDPNPNTKLPHDAYILLVKEYSTDISVKKESEKLILKDLHRKKKPRRKILTGIMMSLSRIHRVLNLLLISGLK